ncbi:MAG: hypothetical protein NZL96_01315 [Patescibacteria group bacterium]|nr:hypothetical protein [Patescibacteria group bacterium]
MKRILSNKITVIITYIISHFFFSINTIIVFLKDDPHPIYGTNLFGLFYLWQLITFVIGVIYLLKIPHLKILIPFLLIITFGSIPTAISVLEPTTALRSFPIIFPFSLIIANRLYQLRNFLRKKTNQQYFNILLVFLFIFSFFQFFIFFQTRIKILSNEQWHRGEKRLFEKIIQEKNEKEKIYIVNNEPRKTFILSTFYNLKNPSLVKEKLKKRDFTHENLIFTNEKISSLKREILIKRYTQDIEKLINEKKTHQ